MSTVRVTVTAEHIASGKPCKYGDCPIALALKEIYPDSLWVSVSPSSALIGRADGASSGFLRFVGGDADVFIDAFDHGQAVSPFTFTAEVSA